MKCAVRFPFLILLLLPPLGHAQVGAPTLALVDPAAPAMVDKISTDDCSVRVVRDGAETALDIAFGHRATWPQVQFQPDRVGYPSDWSAHRFLAVTVGNPTDIPVHVNVRVDSRLETSRGRQGGTGVPPGQRVRMLLPLDSGSDAIIGMRGQPPARIPREDGDIRLAHNGTPLDLGAITLIRVFVGRPERDHRIRLHRIELIRGEGADERPAFVDRFGQYNGADWPGKLHDEREFPERLQAEEDYFAAHPPLSDRNEYGGWKDGPQLDATGRFRVVHHDGKWWFVDPAGRLFWSSGITCVRFNAETVVASRRPCYEWLPGKDDPLARFYEGNGRMFDFFEANAFRKYGENHRERFFETSARRFRAWGVNTIANWSDPDGWRMNQVPYTIPINTPKVPMFVAHSHMMAGLEKKTWFPDPFAPEFRAGLDAQLAAHAEFKDDPWLLGVFIHNELPWTLGSPWNSPRIPTGIAVLCLEKNDVSMMIKRVMVDWLRTRYGGMEDLNRAWGTALADWAAAEAPFALTGEQRERALADLVEMDTLIARQYFRVCREAMDANLPGVLYLGCRFSGMYDRHFAKIAGEYCDVVSFNIYAESPSERTADELAAEFDFPVVIGEFHFGALDRGMFDPGLRRAKDQAERAEKYADYIRQAAAAPWCVGAHWFQYLDQALTGRPDGENYNIGFVDATDDPHPELRAAARKIHSEMYRIRATPVSQSAGTEK